MAFGQRIRQVREELGLTQQDVADRAGKPVVQSTINSLEERDSKRSQHAPRICEVLGINLIWALTGQGEQWADRGTLIRAAHPEDPAPDDEIRIPESRIVKFSGGHGHQVPEFETVADSEPASYRLSWFQKERINPKKVMRFRVVGNSMAPLLFPGDSILVNLAETEVQDGNTYVFRHGDELKVKQLLRRPDGALVLRSINQEEYPDDIVPAEVAAEQITIIGRVRDKSGRGGLSNYLQGSFARVSHIGGASLDRNMLMEVIATVERLRPDLPPDEKAFVIDEIYDLRKSEPTIPTERLLRLVRTPSR